MTKVTLERKLRMALSRILVDEWRLISVRLHGNLRAVSERAVAFQLGWYLRPLLDRMWDIDCEYNRTGAGDEADIKGRLPDLIIHRRGERGASNNLLVLELKTNKEVQRGEHGGSIESVRSLMQAHQYQFGVFLDLGISHDGPVTTVRPEWVWLESASILDQTPERVYKNASSLTALIERGRTEERHRYRM